MGLHVGGSGYYTKVSGKKWVTPATQKQKPTEQKQIITKAD